MRHSSIALDLIALEEARQQPVLGQRRDERAVDAPGRPRRRRSARASSAASDAGALVQVALVAVEMEVERGGEVMRRAAAITATPISSTLAAGSNSSVTPNRPIAG